MNKPHIYKITNQIDGKYYYGVHNGSNTKNYEGSGKLLHLAYKKYGKENFKKQILMWFDTEEEAYEYEAVVVNEKMINKNNQMCYNLALGGAGGDKYSCQTPEQQVEISKKISDSWNNKSEEEITEIRQKQSNSAKETWNNKSEEEKEEISQKRRETWNNKSEEEKEEMNKKISDKLSGENNPMFGKNAYANKTEDEMNVIKQKMSDANKNRTEAEKKSIVEKGLQTKRNNGHVFFSDICPDYIIMSKNTKKYKCPYDNTFHTSQWMGRYITKTHPDKKPWDKYSLAEKEMFVYKENE